MDRAEKSGLPLKTLACRTARAWVNPYLEHLRTRLPRRAYPVAVTPRIDDTLKRFVNGLSNPYPPVIQKQSRPSKGQP